jgi:hypothetical protein
MSEQNAVVAVYGSHAGAEGAVKELQRAGIDMHTLSIVGKDTRTDEHAVGYCNTGDRMKCKGKAGGFGEVSGDYCSDRRFFWDSRYRSSAGSQTFGWVDSGGAGRRGGRGRGERNWRGPLRLGNSEEQRYSIRISRRIGFC